MIYNYIYKTPFNFDDILLTSDGTYLTGLEFLNEPQKLLPKTAHSSCFNSTIMWLDLYFSGFNPDFTPKYHITNLTTFKAEVNSIIKDIPFGSTMTYQEIAQIIAKKRGIPKMSAQAVGGALHNNPICLIIPCHRIIGTNGSLTGYGGGINNKKYLL